MWLTRDFRTAPATVADLTPGSIADLRADGAGVKIDRIEYAGADAVRIHSDHSSRVLKTNTPIILFARDERGALVPTEESLARRAARAARAATVRAARAAQAPRIRALR